MTAEIEDATGRSAGSAEMLAALNDLLQLDYDAIGAYEVAIDKLANRGLAARIEDFQRDHERHVEELNRLIYGLGGLPRNEPHATGPFRQALQSLGSLAGDGGTLMAFRANEARVRAGYAACAERAGGWPVDVRMVVQRNALDEERHCRWAAAVLEELGGGAGLRTEVEERMRASPLPVALLGFGLGFTIGRILR